MWLARGIEEPVAVRSCPRWHHSFEGVDVGPQQRKQRPVDEDGLIFGVVYHVCELRWEEPDVECMQHTTISQ